MSYIAAIEYLDTFKIVASLNSYKGDESRIGIADGALSQSFLTFILIVSVITPFTFKVGVLFEVTG